MLQGHQAPSGNVLLTARRMLLHLPDPGLRHTLAVEGNRRPVAVAAERLAACMGKRLQEQAG